MARPMLGEVELEHVQKIEVDGDQVLIQHGVPALEGDFLQGLGRRATQISLTGVLTGPEAGEGLNTLRDKFRAAEPVSFVADITAATRVDQVLIEEMGLRELAGKPERFEYAFTLREYIPPPPPEEEPEIETPEPPAEEIDENVGTLIVEVIIEGEPDFDFSRVSVTVQGNQQDGTALSRTLTNRTDNIWTEERIPASQGEYTVQAVETNPETRSGSTSAEVRAGERTRVRITLRSGVIIARAFIVHFRFDKSLIELCQRAVMRQVAQYANDHPEEKLVIVGHTDKVGDATQVEPLYNQSLSERRGRSAFAYLTFGHNSQASLDEWNQLRQRRTPGQRLSINDTWGAYEYQFMLQDLGYYRGNIDGDHGPLTDLAIDAFCCASGLPSRQTMDDPTWETLIRAYLAQDDLQVPLDRFFPNCPGEILKWFGCGEESPLLRWGRPPRATAWRPFRRVEVLFVQAEALPSQVPQPDTFDLPQPGAVANGWCVGPTTPGSPRCCLITYEEPEGGDRSRKWWVQPAEPGRITAQGTIRFEGFPPQSRIEFRYVIIAPDGEFMDGEIASGPSRGEPQERRVSGNTNDDGVFEYTFSYPDKPEGVYTLDIRGDFVVRLDSEPSEAATRNVVCNRLNDSDPNFNVTVIARPPLVVNPTITLANRIVVVKKTYTNPARQRVILRLDYPFCHGDGTFNRSQDIIRFFDAATDGTEIRFDNVDNVFPGARLSAGVELFAEGRTHSSRMNDVQLTLTLTPAPTSPGPPVGPAATATMTAVELTLDICVSRTAPGVAPAPLAQPPATPPAAGTTPSDKWYGGRFIHVRYLNTNNHLRALLIVHQAQPSGFSGDLVLRQVTISGNNVTGLSNRVWLYQNEIPPTPPATESPPHPNPFEFNAGTVSAATGRRFWIEGRNESVTLRDTGYQLGIRDLENDGDRVAITVITLALTNNTAPFDNEITRVQIEGVLNRDRNSYDIGDLFNHQADSLFRARADIPGVSGNTVPARLVSTRANGSMIENHDITLTNTSGNRFVSLPLLAIPEAIPRADITFPAPQDIELIRCLAQGRLRLELRGTHTSLVNYEVRVRGRILELCTITIQGAAPNINNYMAAANRVMAQCGIEIRNIPQPTVNNPALLDINQTDCPLTIGGDNTRSAEEQTLFNLGRATCPANFIAYFVRSNSLGSRGCSAYPVGQPGVTVADSASQYTFVHEIGHVLHLPHNSAANNLMIRNTGGLPGNPANVNLLPNQCRLMDNSGFLTFRE